MEDTDNAAKKIPTNESEHFANRLHYERRARKARGKWKSALERLNKQQTTVDDLKQQLAEAEEELENTNEHVEKWLQRYQESSLELEKAVQAHKDMVSKAKPNESMESKGSKEDVGADIFKGLRQQMEAALQGVTSQEELQARNLEQFLQQQLAQTVVQVMQRNIVLRQAAAQQQAAEENTIPADTSTQPKQTKLLEVKKEPVEVLPDAKPAAGVAEGDKPSLEETLEVDMDEDDDDWAKADREQNKGGRARSRTPPAKEPEVHKKDADADASQAARLAAAEAATAAEAEAEGSQQEAPKPQATSQG